MVFVGRSTEASLLMHHDRWSYYHSKEFRNVIKYTGMEVARSERLGRVRSNEIWKLWKSRKGFRVPINQSLLQNQIKIKKVCSRIVHCKKDRASGWNRKYWKQKIATFSGGKKGTSSLVWAVDLRSVNDKKIDVISLSASYFDLSLQGPLCGSTFQLEIFGSSCSIRKWLSLDFWHDVSILVFFIWVIALIAWGYFKIKSWLRKMSKITMCLSCAANQKYMFPRSKSAYSRNI